MATIRLGFVGVGGMGQCAHLANYATLPDCEIAAIAELRPKLGELVARRYGVSRLYEDHRQMLSEGNLDALVAIQPFGTHGRLVPELLEAGLPVITEKPLARSVEMGEKVLAAAQQSAGKLYIAYHKRSDPATVFAKGLIGQWQQSGEFGKLRYVRVTMPPGDWVANGFTGLLGTDDPYPQLQADPASPTMDAPTAERYDAFVNYYIHQVNLMRHLLGEDYRVEYADPSGVLLVARSESGVCGALEMAPYQNSIDWQETALVGFEKGWIRVDLPAPLTANRAGQVTVYEDAGGTPRQWSPALPWVHAMRQQAIHFLKAVQGEKTCLCEPAEALKDLQTAREYIALLK